MNPAKLSKLAVEKYLKEKKKISPPEDLDKNLLSNKGGVFVTINKDGELRGCIGTIEATKDNLAKEIISNAINACKDPRFPTVKEEEFPSLSFEVNILGEKKAISSEKIKNINPQKEGVVVESGAKRGLLLPGIEEVETPEKQLKIVLRKARISPNEDYQVFKFETESYEEM